MLSTAVPGCTLGRYELLLPLARGGMAQVWAARLRGTRGFQKMVAVKTILAEAMEGSRAEQMFLEEATLAAHIQHPNVVGTLDLGEHEGTLYLVMEWVHGEPISQILLRAADSGGIPLPIALNIIGQACKGLHAAHEARDEAGALLGIVHRDVSPHNVLVSYAGTAKLVDFGIAKATARASALTQEGELKGKFAYMAPEQISGRALDRRADVFSMGVLLYTMTTGRHPFRGDSAGQTLRNICVNAPTSPSIILPGYPQALEAVVWKALEKEPDDRFASAYDLVEAIEAAVPESLGSREGEVSQYLERLFGTRAYERMNELKLAQQLADRTQAGATSSSASSLRAVSIDRQAAPPSSTRPSVELEIVEEIPTLAAPPLALARGRKRTGALIAGAAAVLALAAFGAGRLGTTAAPSAAPASAGMRLDPPTPAPANSSVAAAPAPTASSSGAATVAVAPPEEGDGGPPSEPSANKKRSARGAPMKRVVGVAATSAPPAPPVAEHAAPGDAVPARRPNAWNADNYGGRR